MIKKNGTIEQKSDLKNGKPSSAKGTKKDFVLWCVVVLLIATGVVLNIYYDTLAWSLRLIGWIFLAAILVALVSQTTQGRSIWEFGKSARAELRKVIWPTRQETVQTTVVVIGLVVVAALILWGVDGLLMELISWLTH